MGPLTEGPGERVIEYVAPFDRRDRERDHENAWTEFERCFREKQ
jgi:hypothetical protein